MTIEKSRGAASRSPIPIGQFVVPLLRELRPRRGATKAHSGVLIDLTRVAHVHILVQPAMAYRARTSRTMWVAVAAAVVVHGSVLAAVHTFDLSLVGQGFAPVNSKQAAIEDATADVELRPSCAGDAVMAQAARVALCLAPWHDDVDRCLDEAQNDMWIDLSGCQARHDTPIAEVAMLEPRQTDRIKPIDPEPLLDMLEAKAEPPKPVAVPPPAATPPAPPPPPPPKRALQVVETAKPTVEQAPDSARFLAEYDTKVEHQTVARGTPKEQMVAKSKPAELTPKADPREASVKPRDEDRPRGADARAADLPGTLSMRAPGAPSVAALQQQAKMLGSTSSVNAPLAFDGFIPRRGDGAIQQAQQDRSELPARAERRRWRPSRRAEPEAIAGRARARDRRRQCRSHGGRR